MNELKLLPCPFCGSADIKDDNYIRDGREVICVSCFASTHAFHPDANSKAIAVWNTRAKSSEFEAMRDALRVCDKAFGRINLADLNNSVGMEVYEAQNQARAALALARKGE